VIADRFERQAEIVLGPGPLENCVASVHSHFLLNLQFRRQSVASLSESLRNIPATHGPIARHDVFDEPVARCP